MDALQPSASGAELTGAHGVSSGPTAQRQVDAVLRRTLKTAGGGIWLWDLRAHQNAWSDETYRLYGIAPGTVVTPDIFFATIHPDDRERLRRGIDMAIAETGRLEEHHRVVWPDGTVRWLHSISGVTYAADGTPEAMSGIVFDVTARQEQEARLRASEGRLAATMRMVGAGVFEWDFAAERGYWSDELYRLHGLEPGAVPPTPDSFRRLLHPDDVAGTFAVFEQAIAGTGRLADDHRILLPDGRERWLRDTGTIEFEQGRPRYMRGIVTDITEQRLAAERAHEAERRLAHAVEMLRLGVWEYDLVTGTTYWNEENFRMLGCEPGSIQPSGDAFLSRIHPADRERNRETLERALAGEGSLNDVHRIAGPDGESRWVRGIGNVRRDPSGRATGYSGISLDITDLRKAEQAAEDALKKAAHLGLAHAEASRVLAEATTFEEAAPRVLEVLGTHMDWDVGEVWLTDPAADVARQFCSWGREGLDIREAQEASRGMTKRKGAGHVGLGWLTGLPAWNSQLQEQTVEIVRQEEARERGLRTAFAVPILRRGETVGAVGFYSQVTRERDEDVLNTVGSLGTQMGDFMERVSATQALKASERQLRSVIDTALDAVVAIDRDGRIVGWNPQAEQLFGWPAAEMVGRTLDETIIPEGYREAHRRGLRAYLDTGVGRSLNRRIEFEAMRRDGRCFPVELSISVLAPGERRSAARAGELRGEAMFSAFIRDISERRQAEQALRDAKEQAESTARARSEFLAVMSHEIRTPLNGVVGMINLLLKTELSDAQRDQLQAARRSADVLLAVTNDALDFSKIEAGRLVIEQTPFDLDQLLHDVVGAVRSQAAPGVELAVIASGDRPGAVLGDPTRLRQILVNLAGNAVKFTRHGHVHVRVSTAAAHADGSIPFRFLVEDTGIGIPVDKHHDIFEAFSQAESSTTRRFGGTGLGLPIARQLAQLMGGTLLLAESSSAGSVFELRLHLRPATLPRVPVAGQASLRVSGHVLVVDDNRVNRDIASAMLRYAGCTVDVASGGQEAIEAVEHRAYDLVFMDCQMPGMDGYEATSRLRSLGYGSSRLPIVALTAGALAEDRARSLEAGMNDHLSKPLLEDPLLAVLARWLPHAAVAVPKLRADAAATAQAADQPPLFNMETVRRTRELMEEIPGSWEAMVASFITYGTQLIERLTDAVGDARTGEVRQQAHNMKGTAAMIGALRLSSWAADLEQAAQDERMMMCVQLMPRLRAEFDAVARALSSNEFD